MYGSATNLYMQNDHKNIIYLFYPTVFTMNWYNNKAYSSFNLTLLSKSVHSSFKNKHFYS